MRISDWSSDVCSSDLPSQSPVGPQPDGGFFMRALPIVITAALLAGCAAQPTQTVWARLDGTKATQAQLAQDEAACRYEAAQLAYQRPARSEEHTSELQSLMRISYAVFCLKKTIIINTTRQPN